MRAFIANTDIDWYRHFRAVGADDDINFWKPMGDSRFKALSFGQPFIFKAKKAFGHAIIGFGYFTQFHAASVKDAWNAFGPANGALTMQEMLMRVSRYAERNGITHITERHTIGCIILSSSVFFEEKDWIRGPVDWADSIVTGKSYDTMVGEGKRIWDACVATYMRAARHFVAPEPDIDRYGKPTLVKPRLGQNGFRFRLIDTYGQCAVTKEHSIPVLDAAHIIPYSEGGSHDISNGLLLRADIHRLYDDGYVTVTPDHTFKVSDALREDFSNGKHYYGMQGTRIWLPDQPDYQPRRENLEYHYRQIFKA
jgi:putative restriction endonuclease